MSIEDLTPLFQAGTMLIGVAVPIPVSLKSASSPIPAVVETQILSSFNPDLVQELKRLQEELAHFRKERVALADKNKSLTAENQSLTTSNTEQGEIIKEHEAANKKLLAQNFALADKVKNITRELINLSKTIEL